MKIFHHIRSFFSGLFYYYHANVFIFKHRLWPYLILPGVMSICYILLVIFLGISYFPEVSDYLNNRVIPPSIEGETTLFFLMFLLWIFAILLLYLSYQQIVLILFSPILGYLSERVEKIAVGEEPPPFRMVHLVKDIIRSLVINTINMMIMLFCVLLAWSVSFIPIFGVMISPILILLIQAYYGGFGLTDFTLERRRFSIKESFQYNRKNRMLVTGIGMGFILLLMIPVFGWMAAPGYGTVSATLSATNNLKTPSLPAQT